MTVAGRYADDFVVIVNGAREHAEAIREEVAAVLATLWLRLSAAKTSVGHLDEGFDFLGWRIHRRHKQGAPGSGTSTPPVEECAASVTGQVLTLGRRARHGRCLACCPLNPVLRRPDPPPAGPWADA